METFLQSFDKLRVLSTSSGQEGFLLHSYFRRPIQQLTGNRLPSRQEFLLKESREGGKIFVEEEDHDSQIEEKEILEEKTYSLFFCVGVGGETATV